MKTFLRMWAWVSVATLAVCLSSVRAETYAVLVGINDYQSVAFRDLRFAQDDALAMREALMRHAGVRDENIKMLLGEDATRRNFAVAVNGWLAERAKPDDTAILFFSGHGTYATDDNADEDDALDELLCLWDSSALLTLSFLRDDDLNRWLSNVPALEKIVLLDCCHSGTGTKSVFAGDNVVKSVELGGKSLPFVSLDARIRDEQEIERASNRPIRASEATLMAVSAIVDAVEFAGCAPEQVSMESAQLKHGVMTYFLLEGMRGAADSDADDRITFGELKEYATRRIKEKGFRQDPQLNGKNAAETVLVGRTLQVVPAPPKPEIAALPQRPTENDRLVIRVAPYEESPGSGAQSAIFIRLLSAEVAKIPNVRLAEPTDAADNLLLCSVQPQEAGRYTVTVRLAYPNLAEGETPMEIPASAFSSFGSAARMLTEQLAPRINASFAMKALAALENPTSPIRIALKGPSRAEIGGTVSLEFAPNRDCHVYLVNVATDGSLYLLYPNGFASGNFVKAGERVVLPDDSWNIRVAGPPGREIVKAIATMMPITFTDANLETLREAKIYSLPASESGNAIRKLALTALNGLSTAQWATDAVTFDVGNFGLQ